MIMLAYTSLYELGRDADFQCTSRKDLFRGRRQGRSDPFGSEVRFLGLFGMRMIKKKKKKKGMKPPNTSTEPLPRSKPSLETPDRVTLAFFVSALFFMTSFFFHCSVKS